jgi:hypothetical protein
MVSGAVGSERRVPLLIVSNRVKKWHTPVSELFFVTPDCTHAMSNEHLTEALEWIDKRSEHLETLTRKALDKEKAVDGQLTCPISHELFVDPVFCAGDGQTYERSAIERWIKNKKTSPLNNLPLKSTKIYPNYHARKLADIRRQGSAPEGRSNELPESQDSGDGQRLFRESEQLFSPHFHPESHEFGPLPSVEYGTIWDYMDRFLSTPPYGDAIPQ